MYILTFSWRAQDALWDLIASQELALATLDYADAPPVRDSMHQYRDLPMDLADASLVRIAERERLRRLFTLDRRHFARYRPARLGQFVISPELATRTTLPSGPLCNTFRGDGSRGHRFR